MGRLLTCAVLCVLPLGASAQGPASEPLFNSLLHARSLAMGGAFRSQGLSADAAHGNPASMAAVPAYRVDLSGGWDATTKGGYGAASVMDSQTSSVAAGLSYHLVSAGRGSERRTAHVNTVSTAMPLLPFLVLGGSTRHVLMSGARNANAITADAGLLLKFGESFRMGASGHNLIDIYNPDFPLFWTGSASFSTQVFSLTSDVRMEPGRAGSEYSLAAGAEAVLIPWLPLRAGWSTDFATRVQSVSGGLGIQIEGGGLDFAYRQELGGRSERQLALTFRFQIY